MRPQRPFPVLATLRLAAGLGLCVFLQEHLPAQSDTAWKNTATGGDWNNAANWTNGIPSISAQKNAIINAGAVNGPVIAGTEVSARSLRVGDGGISGRLTINALGILRTDLTSFIGAGSSTNGAYGTVYLNSGGIWTSNNDIVVGYHSYGLLSIAGGSSVSATFSLIGNLEEGSGAVYVDGAGSLFQLSQGIVIGDQGPGTMTIRNGGTVRNEEAYIGRSGLPSTVTVETSGTWINRSYVHVANGSSINLRSGGLISIGSGTGTLTMNHGTLTIGSTNDPGTLQAGAVVGEGTTHSSVIFNSSPSYAPYVFGANLGGLLEVRFERGTTVLTGSLNSHYNANGSGFSSFVSDGATLQIGNGGTTGSLNSNVSLNGNSRLVFNRSNAATFGGNISGGSEALIRQIGQGPITLTGEIDHLGDVWVENAPLIVTSDWDFRGELNGTLVLKGSTGAGFVPTVAWGTLQMGDGTASAATYSGGAVDLAAGTTLAFFRNENVTFGGQVTGAGDLRQKGSGALSLSHSLVTFTGKTVIEQGRFVRSNAADANWYSKVSGAGMFVKAGAGVLYLTPNSSLGQTGGTTISQGTLYMNGGLIYGDVLIEAGGTLRPQGQFSHNLSGAGHLLVTGDTERTRLSGLLAYTGTTTVATNGDLVIPTFISNTLAGDIDIRSNAFFEIEQGIGRLTLEGDIVNAGSFTINGNALIRSSAVTGDMRVNGAAEFNAPATGQTVAGNISGAGALTKTGTGTMTLTGANSYTKGITISGGVLRVGNGGATGSLGSGGVTNNASLVFNRSGTLTQAEGVGGSGSLTQAGPGTLILTGNNTYSGVTTITGGTLQIGNEATSGSLASSTIINNATLAFNRSDSTTYGGAISGSGRLTKLGGGTLALTGNHSYTGTTSISAGTLRLGGATASSAFSIASGAVLELAPAADYGTSTTFSGSGTLRKSGTVSARWTGASATFALASGSLIDVQGGTFVGGANGNEIWTNNKSDLHVAAGATFNSVEANVRVDALSGSGIILSGYNGAGYQGFTFGVDNGTGTFGGELADNPGSGVGAHYLKAGSGTQTLTGNNTYTGATTISGGTLQLSGAGRLSDTTAVTVASGGTFDLNGVSDAIGSLTGAGTTTLGSGTLTVGGNGDSTAFAGTISGSGGLVKAGSGTLALTGNTAYSGATSIQGGTLRLAGGFASLGFAIGANAALELAPAADYATSVIFSGSGTLRKSGAVSARWEGAAATFALDSGSLIDVQGGTFVGGAGGNEVWTNNKSDLHVAAGAIFNGVESNVRVDALSGSGLIRSGYNGAGYQGFTFGVDNGSGTFAGELADNPGSGVGAHYIKAGTGTQTLTGNNTYTGTTTLQRGTLALGSAGALGTTSVISFTGGSLKFSAANTTDYSSRFANTSGQVYGIDTNGQNVTFASRVASQNGSLTKTGAGALTLSGTTDNTALAVIVNAGAVVLAKDSSANVHAIGGGSPAANLIVNSGGTTRLGGTGGDQIFTGATVQVNSGGLFDLNGRSEGFSILTGSGTVSNSAAGTTGILTLGEGNSSSTLAASLVNGAGSTALTKVGSGTLTVTGNNAFSGGTTIQAGTLIAGHNQAAGTGTIAVEGGVFFVETGVSATNEIILSGGAYHRSLGAGADLSDAINASSAFASERPDTTAEILQGTLSAQGTLESSFQEHSAALNDAIRLSDVYSLHGTGEDLFVLQLSMTGLDADSYLGWLDTDTGSATYNKWVNAVEGNSGGTPTAFARGYNAATDFHLGYYGVDVEAGTVWAVLNHNSDFAVVPEPATWGLLTGAGLLILSSRRRKIR
jgi:T5SS/PEP-CTERM-associated repeat protein/autotransporter-associated beta strand protein